MSTTLREAAQQALEALEETQQHRAYTQGIPDAITALRDALAQEEQFISLQELAEALGQPDVDSDSEIDKDDMLDMVELQRDLLYHAISLNSKMRKRKT